MTRQKYLYRSRVVLRGAVAGGLGGLVTAQDPALEDLAGTGVGVAADQQHGEVRAAQLLPVAHVAAVDPADGVAGQVLQPDPVVDDQAEQ